MPPKKEKTPSIEKRILKTSDKISKIKERKGAVDLASIPEPEISKMEMLEWALLNDPKLATNILENNSALVSGWLPENKDWVRKNALNILKNCEDPKFKDPKFFVTLLGVITAKIDDLEEISETLKAEITSQALELNDPRLLSYVVKELFGDSHVSTFNVNQVSFDKIFAPKKESYRMLGQTTSPSDVVYARVARVLTTESRPAIAGSVGAIAALIKPSIPQRGWEGSRINDEHVERAAVLLCEFFRDPSNVDKRVLEEIANFESEVNVKRILLKCLSPNITETIFCEMIKQGVSTSYLENQGFVGNVGKFLERAVLGLDIEVLDKIPNAVLIGFFNKEGQQIIKDCIRGCKVGEETRYTDEQIKRIQFLVNRGIEEHITIHTSDNYDLKCSDYAKKVSEETLKIYKAALVKARNSGSEVAGAAGLAVQSVPASAAASPAPGTPAGKPPLPVEGSARSLASEASKASRDSRKSAASKRSFKKLGDETDTDQEHEESEESPVKRPTQTPPSRGAASPATPNSPSSNVQMGGAREDDAQSTTSRDPLVGSQGGKSGKIVRLLNRLTGNRKGK